MECFQVIRNEESNTLCQLKKKKKHSNGFCGYFNKVILFYLVMRIIESDNLMIPLFK